MLLMNNVHIRDIQLMSFWFSQLLKTVESLFLYVMKYLFLNRDSIYLPLEEDLFPTREASISH